MSDKIADLVDRFADQEKPLSNLLDKPTLYELAIQAARNYSGYGALSEHLAIPIADPVPDPPAPYPNITSETILSVSEWAVIKSMFLLYVERETATHLEASRDMGIDVFARTVSEVNSEIANLELNYSHYAFQRDVETI